MFLFKKNGYGFLNCLDIDSKKAISMKNFYYFKSNVDESQKLFDNKSLKYLYIASNHYSHTEYAIEALKEV